jgi:hypothetical protein
VEAQNYIDRADEIIDANPIFDNNMVQKDYIIDLNTLGKKNNLKLTKDQDTSFEKISGKFMLRINLLYGVGAVENSDLTLKHRILGHTREDDSYVFTYKDVEVSEEYGIGLALQYQLTPSIWLSAASRVWPGFKTTGTADHDDSRMGEVKYSFRTLLIDANLGVTYYFYESEKVRIYGNAGAGVAQGYLKERDVLENMFRFNSGQYGVLYRAGDSYTQPMASGAFGIDLMPFALGTFLNVEARFGQYFDIQEAAPESFFSVSIGTGWFF